MTVIEDLAPPPKIEVTPRGVSRRERWQLRLPLLPALIYTIVVTQIPFLVTLWYSFQSYFWNTPAPAHFTGLSNYKTVFTNPAFRGALVRSVVMTATAVIVAMILGVFFAVLLDRKFLGRSIVRTLIITPFLVMPVAAALVWAGPMLDPQFESLGVQVAQQIAGAIAGTESVSQALKTSQAAASQYTPQQLSGG